MNRKEVLLQKYLDGKCTPEEKKQLYQYLKHKEAEDFDHVLRTLWEEVATAEQPHQATSERLFAEISRNTDSKTKVLNIPRSSYLWIAASLTGLLMLFAGLYFYANQEVTHQTQYGEVRTLTLPDQTIIYLNANSTLTYGKGLASDSVREVWLDGEAYFEVNKLASGHAEGQIFKPFIVHTSQVDIEVLGTEFNVKNRSCETEVVLNEGKIQLSSFNSSSEKLAMVPGEKAFVSNTKKLEISPVKEPSLYSSWKQNELYFDQVKLGKIAKELENNFGIQISFDKPSTADLLFTGSAPADELDVLFLTIEKSFNLKIHEDKKGYHISAQ